MAFKYREGSEETIKKRASQQGGDFDSYWADGTQMMKVTEGDHTYRVMPPTWDFDKYKSDTWSLEIWVHFGIGADNAAYLCPNKTFGKGKPCCICDAVADMSKKEAADLKAKKRFACFAIDRDDEKAGPKVWQMGWQSEKDVQKRSQNKKTGEVLRIDHHKRGFDLSFTREGKDKENTKYLAWDLDRDPTPLSEKESRMTAWLEYIEEHPLPSLLVFHSQEHIEDVFMGKKSKDDDDDDDDDDRPTRSKKSKGKSKPKDDDDDDDDDDDEDEKPSKSKDRAKKFKDDDEDDDEDEDEIPSSKQMKKNSKRAKGKKDDDEDDDEDEKPSKKSKKSAKDDDDDDDDDDEKPSKSKSKKSKDDDDDDDEDDDEDEKPSKSKDRAKKSIERMKPKKK